MSWPHSTRSVGNWSPPLDELKTHQRAPGWCCAPGSSDGVYQEEWGKLCVHYAIRALLYQAAHDSDIDPDRVSLTSTLRAGRRSIRRSVGAKVSLAAGIVHATHEMLTELLPRRRLRAKPRSCVARRPSLPSSAPRIAIGLSPPCRLRPPSGSSHHPKLLALRLTGVSGRILGKREVNAATFGVELGGLLCEAGL